MLRSGACSEVGEDGAGHLLLSLEDAIVPEVQVIEAANQGMSPLGNGARDAHQPGALMGSGTSSNDEHSLCTVLPCGSFRD